VVATIFAKSDVRDALRHLCELEVSYHHDVILGQMITTNSTESREPAKLSSLWQHAIKCVLMIYGITINKTMLNLIFTESILQHPLFG